MKISIRFKIMISVMATVLVAFVASALGSTYYFYHTLEEHIVLEEEQKLEQISRQIGYIQSNIVEIAQQIAVDDQVQNCLRDKSEKEIIDNLLEAAQIKEVLRRYINQQSYIYGVTILGADGRNYSSNMTEDGVLLAEEEWYKRFKETGESDGFSDTHMYTVTQGTGRFEAVSYIMCFRNIKKGSDILGDIMIHISCPYLRKYTEIDSRLLQGYALYDMYGNKLVEEGELSLSYDEIKNTEEEKTVQDNKNVLLIRKNIMGDWILASEVSNRLLMEQLRFSGIVFLIVFSCAAIFLVFVLFFIVKSITRPIQQLHMAAIKVGHRNLDVKVDIRTNDELAVLGDAFNTMTGDIQKMMQESIAYEKTTRELEINRLMLQINPHFIYNTLNSIVYMARIKGNEDIVHFSNAFISLLQDTLSTKKDTIFVSIEQELKNVKNYLLLQEYRYPNRFDVAYQLDKAVLDGEVPNVLIQPIVENAVFHGLVAKMEKGHLEIIVRKKGDNIEFIVRDDGVGMPPETVNRILSEEDPIKGEMRTIGVGNVIQRIRHIYGKEYEMQIKSELGLGTMVIITIPYRKYHDGESGKK